jgi:hypothetical protein
MNIEELIHVAPLVSAAAITISASVAVLVLRHNGLSSRRRATLDMIVKTFIDRAEHDAYLDFKAMLKRYESEGRSLTDLIHETEATKADRAKLNKQLNDYEFISLGVRRRIFDETVYKLWFHTQFSKDYERTKPFIDALREKNPSFYCEYAGLYKKWQKHGHPVKAPSRLRQCYWVLTGNRKRLQQALGASS